MSTIAPLGTLVNCDGNPDMWSMIVQHLDDKHIARVCLVSKSALGSETARDELAKRRDRILADACDAMDAVTYAIVVEQKYDLQATIAAHLQLVKQATKQARRLTPLIRRSFDLGLKLLTAARLKRQRVV